MTKTICWVKEDEDKCYWQREWKKLYTIACDMAKTNDELDELLDRLCEE